MSVRHATLGIAALAAMLCAPLGAAAELPPVDIEGLPCAAPRALSKEIANRVASALQSDPGARLTLRMKGSEQLVVSLSSDGRAFEKSISFGASDCDALPVAIGLMVRGWKRELSLLPAPPERPPGAPEEPEPPRAPIPHKETVPDGRFFGGGERGLLFGLQAGGSLSAPASTELFTLNAMADLPLAPRHGLSFDLRWEPHFDAAISPGRIEAERFLFAASYRGRLLSGSAGTLELSAGPALYLLRASSHGFAENGSDLRVGPALSLGTRWLLPLSRDMGGLGRLFGLAALSLTAAGRRERFGLEGIGAGLVIEPVRLALELGLAFEPL